MLAARASQLEHDQQIAAALVLAQRLVADDPLHEHAQRRLMRLHYLRGDRAAALATFHKCRDTLRAELGVAPGAETLHLAALVESSAAWPDPAAVPAPALHAIATLRPPRLVGRDAPWARLDRAARDGKVLLLAGEAGIGKTRLLADFAAAHAALPPFSGLPGDGVLPYALLARLVRGLLARWGAVSAAWVLPELARVAPELGAPAAGQLLPLRLAQALQQALLDWHGAGLRLLLIDDLHHADAATLELLPSLVATPPGGIAWLLGVRPDELPPAIAQWLEASAPAQIERFDLAPLDAPGVQALLASLALPGLAADRWTPQLMQHTGGNPLFLLETLIALFGRPGTGPPQLDGAAPQLPAPASIGRLIAQHLARLSPAALKLARVAAVAGPDFNAALATRVLGLAALEIADSWQALEAAGVLRGPAFAHDLVRGGTDMVATKPDATLPMIDAAAAELLSTESSSVHIQPSAWARVRKNGGVQIGGTVMLLLLLIALAAPWLGTVDPSLFDPASRDLLPGKTGEITTLGGQVLQHRFLMGSDSFGRDIYSRVIFGTQVSLIVGLATALVALAVGISFGLMAGYLRWLDGPLMRVMDGVMAIPAILITISLVAMWRGSLATAVVAIAIPEIPRVTRLVRALVLTIRKEPYVEAAISLGTPTWRIMARHILPNCVAPLVVQGTFICASGILTEAILSFLGVGLPPDIPTWGNVMAEGRAQFNEYPHNIFFPGIFLALTVLSVNILGDGLRDTLDPKMAKRG